MAIKSFREIKEEKEKEESSGLVPLHKENDLMKEKDYNSSAFLLCPPHNLSNDAPNNPWIKDLKGDEKNIDLKKAFKQWSDFYSFLASSSIVYLIPPIKGLQDQSYTANLGIVLPHKKENIAVISNFTSPPRVNEAQEGVDFFRKMAYTVHQTPTKFEGEADLKYLRDNVYIGGYGIRTEKETYDWFEKQFDMEVIKVEMKDEYLYHFDCMFLPLNTDNVVAVTSLIDKPTLRKIEKYATIHDVSKDIGYSGITNSVVFSRTVCTHSNIDDMVSTDENYKDEKAKVERLNEICEKVGFEPVYFNIYEFTKSGALMSCLVMHLSYPDFKHISA